MLAGLIQQDKCGYTWVTSAGFMALFPPVLIWQVARSVILMLHTKFQFPTMPGTGQQVCGGGWVGGMVCKPILVFSFGQAEQNMGNVYTKFN